MDFLQSLGILTIFAWFLFLITIVFGWIMNIATLVVNGYETTLEVIIAIIGIFVAPVGALMYYLVG